MAATAQGAVELRTKLTEIAGQAHAVGVAAAKTKQRVEKVISLLNVRIGDGDPPKDAKILGLQAELSSAQTNLAALAAFNVPTVAELQALAETPDPS